MDIKGEYRDILSRNGNVLVDTGWNSNTIDVDYGRFLAALMKKDFDGQVGIEYMAVGNRSGEDNGSDEGASSKFKNRVKDFFEWRNKDEVNVGPHIVDENWVWAKKIDPDDMIYLDNAGDEISDPKIRTNKLRIDVAFAKDEPPEGADLREFALLGIYEDPTGKFDTSRMFFVNYVDHGLITKEMDTEFTRTVILTFLLQEVIS